MISEELFEMLKSKRKKNIEVIKDVEVIKQKEVEIIQDNKNNNDMVLDFFFKQIEEKDIRINKLNDLIENNQRIIEKKDQRELEEHFKEIDKKLVEIRCGKKNKKWLSSFLSKKK